jgi:hypothetical protein
MKIEWEKKEEQFLIRWSPSGLLKHLTRVELKEITRLEDIMKQELKELLDLHLRSKLANIHGDLHELLDHDHLPIDIPLNCGNPNCEDCNPKFPTMTGINNPEG